MIDGQVEIEDPNGYVLVPLAKEQKARLFMHTCYVHIDRRYALKQSRVCSGSACDVERSAMRSRSVLSSQHRSVVVRQLLWTMLIVC